MYFSASSRRMTGMEIFSTTIHWDQRRGVTWKINCGVERNFEKVRNLSKGGVDGDVLD